MADAETVFDCLECGYPRTAISCSHCQEKLVRKAKRNAFLAAIWGGAYSRDHFTLEAFKANAHNQNAISVCQAFKPLEGHNLYIQGSTGAGKTHLAVATARIHARPDRKIIWKPMELSRAMRGAEDSHDEIRILQNYIEQPILIIDDLGVEKLTDFMFTLIYEIIDGRSMAGRGGLLVTSNLTLDELSDRLGDDRIPSRINGMSRIVDLGADAPDMRFNGPGRIK